MTPRKRGRPDEIANADWWHASSESALSRLRLAIERDIASSELARRWRAFVAVLRRATASWPRTLAARAGSIIDPEISRIASWADNPRVSPPPPSDAALERIGVTLDEWRASLPEVPAPMLVPLFDLSARALEDSQAERALFKLLAVPAPEPLPPAPTSSIDARRQYRRASARLKRHAIGRAHGEFRRRKAAIADVQQGLAQFRARWFTLWRAQVQSVCGDHGKALALAQQIRTETLDELEAIFVPRPAATPKRNPKVTTTTRRKK